MNVAKTALGDVTGSAEGGVVAFRGVPYATAQRFAAPTSPHWSGARDATRDGPIAPQTPSRLRVAMGDFECPMDEDCLTLSIWTPAPDAKARPVLVWLHGGAWQSGAGSLPWYDGGTLSREGDSVVVGVNYRLGALGYLHHPDLGVANPGSLDQIAALRFVQAHISAFGGDPDRVTVMGQSAGASSIGRLIITPEARPLFRAAILQSGSFGRPPLTHADAARNAEAFCRILEIDSPTALRDVPVEKLLAAQGALARQLARFGETNPPFMPILEASMSRATLIAAIAKAAAGMPVLLGATREEVHAFYAADPAMQAPDATQMQARFTALGGDIEAYRARRPGGSDMDLLADLASDHTFLWPTMELAEALASNGSDVFAYQFDWSPQGSKFRACHCIELPFMFGTLPAWDAPMLAGGDPVQMAALSARMRRSWIDFVRTASPGWPTYDLHRRATMRFGDVVDVAGDPAGMETRR
jgi:para-nitrobenzyl esterase